MRQTHALVITAAILLLAAGCTKTDTAAAAAAAKPVATVNGTAISQDVWELYVKARHTGKAPTELTPEQHREALDELIRMYVGAQAAEKEKLATGEAGARIELVKTSALTELLFKQFTEGKAPTEEEIKAEYDARVAELPPLEFHARHILVEDEAKAKDLIAQIDKGADFEKLAKENSQDEGSAEKGGDLDWFAAARMVKPFADALQQLEVGKYTATPVKSEFGWHVIKLEATRASTPPPYETVKAQLGPMVQQKNFEAHLKELVKTAKIERSPTEVTQ